MSQPSRPPIKDLLEQHDNFAPSPDEKTIVALCRYIEELEDTDAARSVPLEEREEQTVRRLCSAVERFKWQPPEAHRQIIWQCFSIISEHYAESNANAEVSHVLGIVEQMQMRRRDPEFRETLDRALATQDLEWPKHVGFANEADEERADARREIERLQNWVNDLQAGCFINCVYCGHRYGPDDEVPSTMADVLKEHIENCPEHPMSKLKAAVDALIFDCLDDSLHSGNGLDACIELLGKKPEDYFPRG